MNQQGRTAAGQVPQRVAQRAAQKGMGAVLAYRKGTSPLLLITVAVVAFAAAIGVIAALNALHMRMPMLRGVAICILIAAPLYVLYVVFTGTERTYLFERGMVVAKGVFVKDAAWAEVAELKVNKADKDGVLAGAVLSYVVRRRDGKKIAIEAGGENDQVGPRLEQILRSGGVPVTQ